MGRILAIDYGRKRTGIAVTDPLKIISSPLETVDTKEVFAFLKKYIGKEDVEGIVVGMPLKQDDSDTDSTKFVRKFIKDIQMVFPEMTIHTVDESYTSKIAVGIMIAAGIKKKDRRKKENIDKISASIILQSYLEGNSL